jgi:hypothetical protein
MSNNTKTIKNNSITGKKRKKIKTEILENDGNKFSVDKQSLSINIQRIFVNSWETKLKVGDEIKFIKPESFEKYNEEFGNVPTPTCIGMNWPRRHRELWGENIRYNKLKKEIDYDKTGIIIEVNFEKEDKTRKYDWFQNTIKVKCPKKVNCDSSKIHTQSYMEIYFEIPLIENVVDAEGKEIYPGIENITDKYDEMAAVKLRSLDEQLNYVENYRSTEFDKYIPECKIITYNHPINEFKVFIPNSRKLRKLDLSKIVLVEGNGFFIEN